jgi:drug/metabolite transporter (DMT)-like permease
MPSATFSVYRRVRARWLALPGTLRGPALLLLAGLFIAASTIGVKIAVTRTDPAEVAALRSLVGWLIFLPFVLREPGSLRTNWPMGHVWRGLVAALSTWSWFWSLAHMPMAEATALGFSKGLFLIGLAVFFLGEPWRWDRAGAAIVGFLGVLVMLRPDQLLAGGVFQVGALGSLGSAMFAAVSAVMVKSLMMRERPLTVLFYYGMSSTLFGLVPAAFVWTWPYWHDVAIILALGFSSAIGQTLFVLAFQQAPASLLAPFEYVQLIYATISGMMLFSEVPGWATVAGAAAIVAANLYLPWREKRRAGG